MCFIRNGGINMATKQVTFSATPVYLRTNYRYDGSGDATPYKDWMVCGTAFTLPAKVTSWSYTFTLEHVNSEESTVTEALVGDRANAVIWFTDIDVSNCDNNLNKWIGSDPTAPASSGGTYYLAIDSDYLTEDHPVSGTTITGSITFTYGQSEPESETIYFTKNRLHCTAQIIGSHTTQGVNKLKIGDGGVSDLYLGSQRVKAVYLGSTLVYSLGTVVDDYGLSVSYEQIYDITYPNQEVRLAGQLLSHNLTQVGTTTLTIATEQGSIANPGAVPVYAYIDRDELYVSIDEDIPCAEGSSAYVTWNWSGILTTTV